MTQNMQLFVLNFQTNGISDLQGKVQEILSSSPFQTGEYWSGSPLTSPQYSDDISHGHIDISPVKSGGNWSESSPMSSPQYANSAEKGIHILEVLS